MKYGYRWLNDLGLEFLKKDYLLPGQGLDERVDIICNRAEELLKRRSLTGKAGRLARRALGKGDIADNFAARFKENLKKGWYSLSSPIWNNYGNSRGLPISCFGSMVEDSMESILEAHSEIGTMTKYGGGTSAYYGKLRGRGSPINQNGTSSGSVHFMQLPNSEIEVISQGSTRRGQCAVYLDIEHPDIEEFLKIKTDGNKIQSLSFGVCVSDEFMEKMVAREERACFLWAKVIEARRKTGYPYIFFIGNANRGKPACYHTEEYVIYHSNLCTEIMLPNGKVLGPSRRWFDRLLRRKQDSGGESFVCDLASMNILYYREWKNTDAVDLLVYFLDTVMTEFIDKASKLRYMERPVRFAKRHRALGVGWLGWHSFLQSEMVPFESFVAMSWNREIAQEIHRQGHRASAKLCEVFGPPEGFPKLGRRNTTLFAIAPTKSSSFIHGQVSEAVQPFESNYYVRDLQKGKFSIRNPELTRVLQTYDRDDEETWSSILKKGGSVQHLDFLPEDVRAVFKTFSEISAMSIVKQAAQRQKWIDQGQSLNLKIAADVPVWQENEVYIEAWRSGVKSLYYRMSANAAQQFARNITECVACGS